MSGDRATDSLGRGQEGVAVSIKAWMADGVWESRQLGDYRWPHQALGKHYRLETE